MKKVLLIVGIVLLVAVGGFVVWAEMPLGPMPEALDALNSTAEVTVSESEEGWIVFEPVEATGDTTFIFYPGGRVDERSYAPLLMGIAEEGYRTILVPMPLNLAVFDINEGMEVVAAYPNVTTWVIGGHSLGGAMAANVVYNHPGTFDGLILYGSYPADSNDLSEFDLAVLSLYGPNDGGAEEIAGSLDLLPEGARLVRIEGGNHAQFGDYGLQGGDGAATISREEQQEKAIQHTQTFLQSLN